MSSKHPVKETIDRLVVLLQQRDMTIYARVNRQVESKWYGRVIRPFEFILVDDPQFSGPLVEKNPLLGLRFPTRIIAWEDDKAGCWVAFGDALRPDLAQEISQTISEWQSTAI